MSFWQISQLPEHTITHKGVVLRRVILKSATKNLRTGHVGGFVQHERNIKDSAIVLDDAKVYGSAVVSGHAHICGEVEVYSNAKVSGESFLCGKSRVYDSAVVKGQVVVQDDVSIFGKAVVSEGARLEDSTSIYENAKVKGIAVLKDTSSVSGNAVVQGGTILTERACITGSSRLCVSVPVPWSMFLELRSVTLTDDNYLILGPAKSSKRYTLAFKEKQTGVTVITGCFRGNLTEFSKAIEETHKNNKEALHQYRLFCQVIAFNFGITGAE